MPSFLFDTKLAAAIRVEADTEEIAREKLAELLDCACANFGEIGGDPVLGEVSIFVEEEDGDGLTLAED